MPVQINPLSFPAPEFAKLTYPRYRKLLIEELEPDAQVEGIGAWDGDVPIGLLLLLHMKANKMNPEATTRILSVFVDKVWRRKGIGRLLMEQAVSMAQAAGATQLQAFHSSRTRSRHVFENFLASNGWGQPELLEFRLGALAECTKQLAVSWAPLIKRAKRNGYSVTPWFDMTTADREALEMLTETEKPPLSMHYKYHEERADPELSLVLRQHGKASGWIIAETPEDRAHHHYTAGFVRSDLQRAGWLAIGIFDASQLQYKHYGPKSVTLYETTGDNSEMIAFMKRRQAFVTEWMDERYISRKNI